MEVQFTNAPQDCDFHLGFTNKGDSEFTINFYREPGGVRVVATGEADYTSIIRTVPPIISGSEGDPTDDLFDGEWHTITIKIEDSPTINTEGLALIFVDSKWVGEIWMNGEDYKTQSGGIPTAEELMAVEFGTHTLGGAITTGVGNVIVLQQ